LNTKLYLIKTANIKELKNFSGMKYENL